MKAKNNKKEDKFVPFKCPYCGNNEAKIDSFAQLKGVRRAIPGNLICTKCKEPVPYTSY